MFNAIILVLTMLAADGDVLKRDVLGEFHGRDAQEACADYRARLFTPNGDRAQVHPKIMEKVEAANANRFRLDCVKGLVVYPDWHEAAE